MPVMGGFELLGRLNGGRLPLVVMVIAYDQHAIRAFDAGAVDYLLKPVGQERLLQAVENAKRIARDPQAVAENLLRLHEIAPLPKPEDRRLRKIVGRIGEEYFLLDLEAILAFQATGDAVRIITAKQSYWATQNLKTIACRLGGHFVPQNPSQRSRQHRSS